MLLVDELLPLELLPAVVPPANGLLPAVVPPEPGLLPAVVPPEPGLLPAVAGEPAPEPAAKNSAGQ